MSGAAQRPVYIQIYLGFGSRPFGSLRFKPLSAPSLAAVILATDTAEMGLITALHMLTGAAGSGGSATRRTTPGLTTCSSFSASRNASLGARPISRKNPSRVKLLHPPPACLGEAEALPAAVRHQPLCLQLPHHLQGVAGFHAEGPASFEGVKPSPKGCVVSR